MGLQDAFDVLSEVLEQFDAQDRSVRDVEVTTDTDRADALDVTMIVPVSLCAASSEGADSSLTPQRASLSESGGLTVTVSVSDLLPDLAATETVVGIDQQAVHVEDGELVMTVSFCVESTGSTAGATTAAEDRTHADEPHTDELRHDAPSEHAADGAEDSLDARLAAARSDDVPAYEDTDYLCCLYESCGTFTEMSERIEMDVAAETVRRYMIEADIHDPTSYDTAAHGSGCDEDSDTAADDPVSAAGEPDTAEEDARPDASPSAAEETGPGPSPSTPEPIPDEQFVTDGIGLPDGVTVEDIVDAVVDSTAVYEVERSLDLDRGQARGLLRQLNVLDLVLHRIDDPQQDTLKNDVVKRIRQCTTGAT